MDRLTREEIADWRRWARKGSTMEFGPKLNAKFIALCDLALQSLESVRSEAEKVLRDSLQLCREYAANEKIDRRYLGQLIEAAASAALSPARVAEGDDNTCQRCGHAIRREFDGHEVCECPEPLRKPPESPAKEQPGEVAEMVKRLERYAGHDSIRGVEIDGESVSKQFYEAAELLAKLGQDSIAALRRSQPEGVVMVPREPTEAMLAAAAWELGDFYAKEGGYCGSKAGEEQARLTYRAMLSACEEKK